MRRFRQWNSLSHTWLGLIFGMVFAAMGITGAMLNLAPELERVFYPSTASRVVCRGDVSLAGLEPEMARVGQPVDRIFLAEDKDSRVHVRARRGPGEDYAHWIFDGCAGKLAGSAPLRWLDWVTDLHHNFLNGKTGRKVVGVTGLLLLLNALTALMLWLMTRPRLGHLWPAPARAGGRAGNYHLHRSAGLLAMLFLLLEASTGFFLAFPVGAAKTAKPPRAKAELLPLDRYLEAARQLRPDARVREIRTGSPVAVYFWPEPGKWPSGDGQILLGRADAAWLGNAPKPAFMAVVAWLHYSEWGGPPARYLAAALGLAPALLLFTGFLIWWLPRAAARARRQSSRPGFTVPAEIAVRSTTL